MYQQRHTRIVTTQVLRVMSLAGSNGSGSLRFIRCLGSRHHKAVNKISSELSLLKKSEFPKFLIHIIFLNNFKMFT